jgi:hypothetical protein
MRMVDDWRPMLVDRLLNTANAVGVWGYRPAGTGSAEPTALAALALAATGQLPERVDTALQWLARLQRSDGAVGISPGVHSPHWPTALALLAWLRCLPQDHQTYKAQSEKAIEWLISTCGRGISPDPTVYDHDTALVGWPWVTGCHSWLEPTAYAILALRAAGKARHPRVREGVRLILDRALPTGGWNYGNPRVLAHVLRPFPATTGVALAALAGEPHDGRVEAALEYLTRELPGVCTPLSLAWGLIGMRAWNAQPRKAQAWLERSARQAADRLANPHYDALLLLASADACPLFATSKVQTDG